MALVHDDDDHGDDGEEDGVDAGSTPRRACGPLEIKSVDGFQVMHGRSVV